LVNFSRGGSATAMFVFDEPLGSVVSLISDRIFSTYPTKRLPIQNSGH
jgi:hypothetical protein